MARWSGDGKIRVGVRGLICRYLGDRRGNVSVIVAIMIVPLVGMLSLAGEVSSWYTINRSLQNASDAAAIAAARNTDTSNDTGATPIPRYQREANAVASQYGLVNGVSNVTVTPTTVACAAGGVNPCYQVTITKTVPSLLAGITGFTGDATLGGGHAQIISATAIATKAAGATNFCILALGGSINSGITGNGNPSGNLAGCSVASNGDADCHGHDLGADAGYAYYSDNCGAQTHSGVRPAFSDDLDKARLTDTAGTNDYNHCAGSFPQESGTLPTSNEWSAAPTLSTTSDNVFCGDVQLQSDITLASGGTIVIENGVLDMNGHNLTGTGGVTIVFSGDTTSTAGHILTDNSHPGNKSVLTLTAPSSGAFSGVAIYQDPSLTSGVNITNAGVGPTWNISGLVYLPNSNVTISGAINKNATNNCFGLVVSTITISGTGDIVDQGNCGGTGTTLPGTPGTIVALVQ
jgi:Flp pilus assembly protein TadG